jgi:hypothetical protein
MPNTPATDIILRKMVSVDPPSNQLHHTLPMAASGELEPEALGQGNGWRDPNQPFRPALEVNLFRNCDRVIHLNIEVPHGALQLDVAEKVRSVGGIR